METRTELILLQRTMVVVEGVARSLNPQINIWEVIAIANEGLKARCIPSSNLKFPDETHFLDALNEVVESERTAADKLIELYRNNWNQDVSKVFDQHSY